MIIEEINISRWCATMTEIKPLSHRHIHIWLQGLPEQPLRNILLSNIKANCNSLAKMRDVQGFVLRNADIQATDPTISTDGCTATMLLNVKVNGKEPQDFAYPGIKSTPIITMR